MGQCYCRYRRRQFVFVQLPKFVLPQFVHVAIYCTPCFPAIASHLISESGQCLQAQNIGSASSIGARFGILQCRHG
jgi:hypothetical protein